MTQDEQRALKRMESKITILTQNVEQLAQLKPVMDRVNRALVGDEEYGDTGLIVEHRDVKRRVGDIETRVEKIEEAVEDLKTIGGLLRTAGQKVPALGFGVMVLYLWTGGDLGSVMQFILGVLR